LLEIDISAVSPYEKPTRAEALRYYRRVVDTYDLHVEFGEQVVSIEREGAPGADGVFLLETRSDKGVRRIRQSRNVILAIGYFDHPNVLGIPGENLLIRALLPEPTPTIGSVSRSSAATLAETALSCFIAPMSPGSLSS
jgi:hypothetical protein